METPLPTAVTISTNDGGQHLKLVCGSCAAETYVKMPTTAAIILATAAAHTRPH